MLLQKNICKLSCPLSLSLGSVFSVWGFILIWAFSMGH